MKYTFDQSADILNLPISTFSRPEITTERPPKQLQQHLEANASNARVISALTQLIPDERMLSPGNLVEAERSTRIVQRLPDQIAAFWRDVVVTLAEDHDELAVDVLDPLETVVVFALAEAMAVDVGCEVADCGADSLVECAAEGEMASEAHAFEEYQGSETGLSNSRDLPVAPTLPLQFSSPTRQSILKAASSS